MNSVNYTGRVASIKFNDKTLTGEGTTWILLAVDKRKKDENGNTLANFIPCRAFNGAAAAAAKHVGVGSLIAFSGSTEVQDDKSIECWGNVVEFLALKAPVAA